MPRLVSRFLPALAVALLAFAPAAALTQAPVIAVQPAADGIFQAFRTHPLVGLGDEHGLLQGMDFYAALIRDPRFAREVGNVVVEFGGEGRQGVVDRYVAGANVPYAELRMVWTDTVGWLPTAGYLGFARLLATVREANRGLPPARRIRVWLGEPPLDWANAPTREQLMAAMNARDSHPADLIAREILAHRRKALVIYGGLHFGGGNWLRGRVEAAHPGAFFVALPYAGMHQPASCAPWLAEAARVWPTPALAVPGPASGDCASLRGPGGGAVAAEGVLFYGPPAAMRRGPFLPDYALDDGYRREVARRSRIGGPPLVRFPPGFSFRKSDYAVDLHAPGFAAAIDAMFAAHDRNGDGVVTAEEYVDPIPQ
jgi:hypothetical protein